MKGSSRSREAELDPLLLPSGGMILALETSGAEGSVALAAWEGGGIREPGSPGTGEGGRNGGLRTPGSRVRVLARASLAREEEHPALLLPRVAELLKVVGVGRSDLTGVVVGSGPGSFTGVRVAAVTAKALAWALRLPLWAFSSLAAAAMGGEGVEGSEIGGPGEDPAHLPDLALHATLRPRCVLFDARGDRVYAGAFRVAHGSLETLVAPTASTVFEMMDGIIPPGSLLMGEGAVRHRDIFLGAGYAVLPLPFGCPSAEGLLRLLELDPLKPPVPDPGRWEPDYLRASGAEQLWRTRREGEG